VNTALWFDEQYVTTDVPPPEDLETFLEVGSWSWGWMEPPMGQLSFFLLCMAWARNQMLNIHVKPYTTWMMNKRASSLAGICHPIFQLLSTFLFFIIIIIIYFFPMSLIVYIIFSIITYFGCHFHYMYVLTSQVPSV
jgi:hypothetical protein